MPIIVNTNTASLNAQRYLGFNNAMLSRTMEQLSSGYRINRAGDDAAGLFVSEQLRTQIRGSKMAYNNTQDSLNMLNIADGALQTITDNLQRIRELTVQAGNDTYAQSQRTAANLEIDALRSDIDRIANSTVFNGNNLLNAATPANFYVQLGPNGNAANDRLDIASALGDVRANAAGGLNMVTAAAANIIDNTSAQTYLTNVDSALTILNTKRANLGAFVNRLQGTANNLSIAIENLSNAESRIRNVDIASASAEMSKYNILQQSATAILAQANQSPSIALKLLGQ